MRTADICSNGEDIRLWIYNAAQCTMTPILKRTVIASDRRSDSKQAENCIASDRYEWVSNHERKSNPNPNPNHTLTDHSDLTLSIFPSLHSDRRSEPIITVLRMWPLQSGAESLDIENLVFTIQMVA